MTHTIRVGRMRRDKGISVARPSALGNPFVIGEHGDRDAVILKYRAWFADAAKNNPRVQAALLAIIRAIEDGDVTLLCWCEPKPCHADVIAEWVRAQRPTP